MKYIVITGGLSNKGSQSMVFTVIAELKRTCPEREIVVLSTNGFDEVPAEVRACYAFKVLPWTTGIKLRCLGGWWPIAAGLDRLTGRHKYLAYLPEIRSILSHSDLAIDASGYSLTSQWKADRSFKFLLGLAVFRKFGLKTYLFPQSFGPFTYPFPKRLAVLPLMKKLLRYPIKIYAREEEGYLAMKPFAANNLERACDIVLQCKRVDLSNIYRSIPPRETASYEIPPNSAALVPSKRLMQQGSPEELLEIHHQVISFLLERGMTVHVVRHSFQDGAVCQAIKDLFPEEARVILIGDDLNCVQLTRILSQFEVIMAARYHSIVHAYKSGVPALVLGWAVKYEGLARYFGQEQYLLDVRHHLEARAVIQLLEELLANRDVESEKILARLESARRRTVFDDLVL